MYALHLASLPHSLPSSPLLPQISLFVKLLVVVGRGGGGRQDERMGGRGAKYTHLSPAGPADTPGQEGHDSMVSMVSLVCCFLNGGGGGGGGVTE